MVDRALKIMLLPINLHEHLVAVPAPVTDPAYARNALPLNFRGEQRAKPVPPEPHCLVANVGSTFEQKVFDIPKRQREPHLHDHN
jgi:hypothetical protein